jgi:hypothetical protein
MKLHQRLDQEAAELWTRPRAEVRDRLIAHYTPFAEAIAGKRAAGNRRVSRDVFMQDALIALWECVESYEPDNPEGAVFTTFARERIRFAVIDSERDAVWVKPKVRAAEKAGEIELPAMLAIRETFDAAGKEPEAESGLPCLADLLEKLHGVHRERLQLLLDCDCDWELAAKVYHTTVYNLQTLITAAIKETREIPYAA